MAYWFFLTYVIAYVIGWLTSAFLIIRDDVGGDVEGAAFALIVALIWPVTAMAWALRTLANASYGRAR